MSNSQVARHTGDRDELAPDAREPKKDIDNSPYSMLRTPIPS